jgi:hypothetical protein
LEDIAPEVRTAKILEVVFAARAHRVLLTPAEAINTATVGARHADEPGNNGKRREQR